MKKNYAILMLFVAIISLPQLVTAQEKKVVQKQMNVALTPAHRIVFQVNSGDTLVHKQLMKQLSNISSVAPGTQLEVVCHGPGLDMLQKEKSIVTDKIIQQAASGVVFNACEFSMQERKVEKSQMITEVSFVPAGILEIITRQEQGWSYIKSGF